MSRTARLVLFGFAAAGFGVVLVYGLAGLPAFGDYKAVYGNVINGIGVTARHATDLVTAINFDIRAFDTLGEEFILFASVSGVALLLRKLRDEDEDEDGGSMAEGVEEHRFAGASDGLKLASLILIPLVVALGAYLVLHGQLTPGGGFQGGVVLAAGPVAILLAGRYLSMKAVAPKRLAESADAIGAAGYALIGLGGLVFAGIYLKNPVPLGAAGHLLSGGMMPLNSLAVGIEVTGAFLVTWTEFLDQTLIASPSGSGG